VWKEYDIRRSFFYPILLSDSLRMGFARIGKGRITYIRTGVDWSQTSKI